MTSQLKGGMRRIIIYMALVFALKGTANAQVSDKRSVIIGVPTEKPNAVLALNPPDRDQGFLLPQLTTQERISIPAKSPEEDGLIVYDLTEKSFFFWKDSGWQKGLGSETLNQKITFNPVTNTLHMTGGGSVDLSGLKELPSIQGNKGKFLTTDGVTLRWSDAADITSVTAGAGLRGGASAGDASLSVKVDGNTLGFNDSDEIEIMDLAVTGNKISPASISTSHMAVGEKNSILSTSPTGIPEWRDINELKGPDNQILTYNSARRELAISKSSSTVDLSGLVDLDKTTKTGVLTGSGGQVTGINGTANGQLLKWDGTSWNPGTVDANGLQNGAVTNLKLAPSSVSTANVISGGSNKMLSTNAAGVVGWSDISSLTVGGQLSGSINNLSIVDNTVNSSDIQNGTIVSADISAGGISPDRLASGGNNKVLTTNATGSITWEDKSLLQTVAPVVSGDAVGLGAVTVVKIQGVEVSNTPPTDNQVLQFDAGTNKWVPQTVTTISPSTQYYSIDPADFTDLVRSDKLDKNNVIIYEINTTFATVFKKDEGGGMVAPIHLPHGAVMESVTVFYTDDDANNIQMAIQKKPYAGANTLISSWTSSSDDNSVSSVDIMASVPDEVIDNFNYSYRIELRLDQATDATSPANATHRIYGVRITYTE